MAHAALLLVSTLTDAEGIFVYRLVDEDGRLELRRQTPGIDHPFFIALHPSGRSLYAIAAPAGAQLVKAFAFDRGTGVLEPLNERTTRGGYPCYVEVDPSGRALVAANYSGGSVISFPLGEDGALGAGGSFFQHQGSSIDPERQREPHAHCFTIAADGRYAFAADLGTDRIMIYALDAAAGTLSPGEPPSARVAPGAGPRHVAFHPSNRFAHHVGRPGQRTWHGRHPRLAGGVRP